jgi:3-carboxy-cis,cis-muconate cycloisomerase
MAIFEGRSKNLGEEGQFIHWGATSQDVMNTSLVLQAREALDILLERLREIEDCLANHLKTYADTP